MEIINHRLVGSKVRATARAGAQNAAGAPYPRDASDFFPFGTTASALIVPRARHSALIIYWKPACRRR